LKAIRFTKHSLEQCSERGASQEEVEVAIRKGNREPAKKDREIFKYNFSYDDLWQGKHYSIKQVAPVIVEEDEEIIVITVYVFYF